MPLLRDALRSRARSAAITALAARDRLRGAIDAGLRRPRVHFLYTHHVLPDRLPAFRKLLARLADHGTFVSYSRAVELVRRGPIDRPYYNVNYDDGYTSCRAAAEAMDAFGAPGCFFVNPSIVGADDADAARFSVERVRGAPRTYMGWDDLEDLMKRGHEVGNHTLTHTDLGRPDRPLDEEIGGAREVLVKRLGDDAGKHFAWPFGLFKNVTAEAKRAVYAAGHDTCASAVRGAHVAPCGGDLARLCVRREHLYMGWPAGHNAFFAARSSRRATAADNDWPADEKLGPRA